MRDDERFIAERELECHLCGRIIEIGEAYGEDLARACTECDASIAPACESCGDELTREGHCLSCLADEADYRSDT